MNARDVVTTRMVAQARRFPDLDISPLNTAALDAREAALALAIDRAVIGRWLTLVTIIESRLNTPWHEIEVKVQAALLVGAAQLLLLDRLPDHAVINETVEWAKRNVRPKAGGLINAVLRKIVALRDSQGKEKTTLSTLDLPVFDRETVRRLSQQTSHAEALIVHWLTCFGEQTTTALAMHSLVHAPIIVHELNEQHAPPPALIDRAFDQWLPHKEAGFFAFAGDRGTFIEALQRTPSLIVQDPTSAAAARATAALSPSPRLIIDACAGKGTKTRQLAALHPQARIIATDIDRDRLEILRKHFANHDRVEVIEHDRLRQFDDQADLLVLDVPCSNTGVLARRIEAKYRFNHETLRKVVDLQRQIIADALPVLSANGRVLYSTCSIDKAENEQQAQWITKWHPFRIVHAQTRMPTGSPGDAPSLYSDGGYHAILQRQGK